MSSHFCYLEIPSAKHWKSEVFKVVSVKELCNKVSKPSKVETKQNQGRFQFRHNLRELSARQSWTWLELIGVQAKKNLCNVPRTDPIQREKTALIPSWDNHVTFSI